MEYIDLVIKISEESYKATCNGSMLPPDVEDIVQGIKNGTKLPKGHGRIGDLDKLIKAMKNRNEDNGGEPLNAVDKGYDLAYQHMTEEVKECVIIEADKESEDERILETF